MKISVVVQGPIFDYTGQVIRNYVDSPLIDKVIYSGWSNLPKPKLILDKVIDVYQLPIDNPGIGNRNWQIQSSRLGIKLVDTEFCWKVRSDQIIPIDTIKIIYDFIEYIHNKTGEYHKLFVMGDYRLFPFHPRDHFFAGLTTNVKHLFDCPYDTYFGPVDYQKCTRAETWLGANYLGNMYWQVKEMINKPEEYLVDDAPKIKEALKLSSTLTKEYFQVLPRIQWSWPKHGLESYHYHVGESFGEYWYEDIQSK